MSTCNHDPLFIENGLIEPEPTKEMARLLNVLRTFDRHPAYDGCSKQRQMWELHRALYGESYVAINLMTEHFSEDKTRRYVPLCREVRRLAEISYDAWAALVELGMDVDDMGEPYLPPPRKRRRIRRVRLND